MHEYHFDNLNQSHFAESYIKCFYDRPNDERDWHEHKNDEQYRIDNINAWLKKYDIHITYLYAIYAQSNNECLIIIEFDNKINFDAIKHHLDIWRLDKLFNAGIDNADYPLQICEMGQCCYKLIINETY